jgi:hypothetical protein
MCLSFSGQSAEPIAIHHQIAHQLLLITINLDSFIKRNVESLDRRKWHFQSFHYLLIMILEMLWNFKLGKCTSSLPEILIIWDTNRE